MSLTLKWTSAVTPYFFLLLSKGYLLPYCMTSWKICAYKHFGGEHPSKKLCLKYGRPVIKALYVTYSIYFRPSCLLMSFLWGRQDLLVKDYQRTLTCPSSKVTKYGNRNRICIHTWNIFHRSYFAFPDRFHSELHFIRFEKHLLEGSVSKRASSTCDIGEAYYKYFLLNIWL